VYMLKTNKPILMPIGTSGPWSKAMKRSILGSGGQSSRSHNDKVAFEGLARALFSTALVD